MQAQGARSVQFKLGMLKFLANSCFPFFSAAFLISASASLNRLVEISQRGDSGIKNQSKSWRNEMQETVSWRVNQVSNRLATELRMIIPTAKEADGATPRTVLKETQGRKGTASFLPTISMEREKEQLKSPCWPTPVKNLSKTSKLIHFIWLALLLSRSKTQA